MSIDTLKVIQGVFHVLSKAKAICYFLETSLYERDYERFGIDVFKRRGYEIYAFNLERCLYPELENGYDPLSKKSDMNVLRPETWGEFEDMMGEVSLSIGMVIVGYDRRSLPLYQVFKRLNYVYAQYSCGTVPRSPRTWAWLKGLFFGGRFRSRAALLFDRLLFRLFNGSV